MLKFSSSSSLSLLAEPKLQSVRGQLVSQQVYLPVDHQLGVVGLVQSPGVAAPLVVGLHRHSPPAHNRHVHGPEPSGPQQLAQDDLVLVDSSAACWCVAPGDGRAYVAAGVGRAEVEQCFADHVELRMLVGFFGGFRTGPEAEAEYGHRQIKHNRIIIIYDHNCVDLLYSSKR